MRRVRDVLRLRTAGVGLNEIARRVGVAPSTVRLTLQRLANAGLSWPLPAEMTDATLEATLFAAVGTKQGHRRHLEPDWEPPLNRPLSLYLSKPISRSPTPVAVSGPRPNIVNASLGRGGLPMKIAQIAPLYERVPPLLYGGTERMVSYLTEELVRQGHEVTLFASGDSQTRAALVPCSDSALRLNPLIRDPLPYHLMMMEEVGRRAAEFDVLHFHTDLVHFPLLQHLGKPSVTTVHGRLDLADLKPVYDFFHRVPLVSISADQRHPLPSANWVGTVHHGLPVDGLTFNASVRGGYLAFLGRISPEKCPDRAIEIATRVGMPLRVAAKIDKTDQAYWDTVVRPLVEKNANVEFVGEINDDAKADFLGNALALLFPIDWPEPFGLVMIEAMACGTPVIPFRQGSVPEIIEHGVSGFIVDDIDGAVQAVANVQTLNRAEVRRCFEQRFTAERMAGDYVAIYQSLSVRATTDHRRAKGNELDVPRVRLTSRDILDNPWQWIHGSPGS